MKVMELRAKRTEVIALIHDSVNYFEKKETEVQPGGVIFSSFGKKLTEEQMKKARENDYQLLKKLDAINNALFESDAKTYIDVLGSHLSIATARQYLRELSNDEEDEDIFDFDQASYNRMVSLSDNAHCYVNNKNFLPPWVNNDDDYVDPMRLLEREEEFKKKRVEWRIGLKSAVAISDATTEVAYHD